MKTLQEQIDEKTDEIIEFLWQLIPDIPEGFHERLMKLRKELSALKSQLSEPEKELKLNKTAEEYFKSRLQKPNRDNNYVISADLLHEYMKDFASQFQEQPITDVMLKEKAQKFLNSRMIVDSEYWDYDKTKFVLSDILVKWALSLKAKPIDLKDELIKFLKWYHPSGAQIEPMIDKYLSQYNPSPKAQKGE
jgi:hypothetical protein